MIVVVVDTVKVEPDIEKARLVVFVNTKARATKKYSEAKKRAKMFIEIKLNGNVEMNYNDYITFLAHIGSFFAEYKERIVVFESDKAVVFAKGCGGLGY